MEEHDTMGVPVFAAISIIPRASSVDSSIVASICKRRNAIPHTFTGDGPEGSAPRYSISADGANPEPSQLRIVSK